MREPVAEKRCENGHTIDESWDLCPYCPARKQESIAIVRPQRQTTSPPARAADKPSPMKISPRPAAPQSEAPARTVAAARIDPALLTATRYVVGWLVALDGSLKGESFPIRMGRNVLGRDQRSDIFINDDQASAHHADLVYRPEEKRYILMDHNSTNGTYVNEVEIEPRKNLAPKDIIRIGTHRLMFVALIQDDFSWDSE